jgi:hypothetical protein
MGSSSLGMEHPREFFSVPERSQHFHQVANARSPGLAVDRVLPIPGIYNQASSRFEIFAGSIELYFRSAHQIALDLDCPKAVTRDVEDEIHLSTGSGPVKTGNLMLGNNLQQVLDHHAFPGRSSRVPGKVVECSNIQQCMHQTAVSNTDLAGFDQALAQISAKGQELAQKQ